MSSISPPISVYLSYTDEDEVLAKQLQSYLAPLRRGDIVILDVPIRPGSELSREKDNNLNNADIILLLISVDFFASDYFYNVEMARALERHDAKEACVVPVLLRSVDWQGVPFDNLQVLPLDGRPITTWESRDDALVNVVQGIREVIERVRNEGLAPPSVSETTPQQIIASLPINVQDVARSGELFPLKSAIDDYLTGHKNERLVIGGNDGFFYYENISQVTYMWQIWQTLSEFVADHKTSQLMPLFEELSSSLGSSLNTIVGRPIKQGHSSAFFFTTLDTQYIFAHPNMPRQIPVIFCTVPSFNMSHNNELRQLLVDLLVPPSRFAILLFFTGPTYLSESRGFLKQLQKAYAYDIIPMACDEFLKITEAREPSNTFRQWLLPQADLSRISPFILTGPTPVGMFFGRELELQTITTNVYTTSYALIGGRRIGKTSILRHLWLVGLPKIGIQAFYQDCSFIQAQTGLVQAVTVSRSWFPEAPSTPFLSFADVIQALPYERSIALLLDEVDKLIEPDKSAGYPLFNMLRASANAGRCQFVFAGEYTLLNDMKNSSSPLYNFANELLVGHLDAHAVRELVVQPMHDLEIEFEDEDAIVKRIWDFTAGHPNVVQRLCKRLVMRINGRHPLQLNIEDVNDVIADVDFLRVDFLETYWGQATSLERLCTLVMAKQRGILLTLVDVHAALSNLVPDVTLSDVNDALEGLVNLRNLLQHTPQGYVFTVKGFPKVFAQTYALDDLVALTCEKYRLAKRNTSP